MGNTFAYFASLFSKSKEELIDEIQDICCNMVYGVWNADGVLVYAGQTSMSLISRVKQHLMSVFRTSKNPPRWEKQLSQYLDNGGVKFSIIASGLAKEEANKLEMVMIAVSKRECEKHNIEPGNFCRGCDISSFRGATFEDFQAEMDKWFEHAITMSTHPDSSITVADKIQAENLIKGRCIKCGKSDILNDKGLCVRKCLLYPLDSPCKECGTVGSHGCHVNLEGYCIKCAPIIAKQKKAGLPSSESEVSETEYSSSQSEVGEF